MPRVAPTLYDFVGADDGEYLRVTEAGARRLDGALSQWSKAQAGFEAAFGGSQASDLRRLLRSVVATEFEPAPNR